MSSPQLVVSIPANQASIVAADYDTLVASMTTMGERLEALIKQGLMSKRCVIRFGVPYQNGYGEWVSDVDLLTNPPSTWNIPTEGVV